MPSIKLKECEMSPKPRYRLQFKFWLNMQSERDAYIAEIIEWLKKERTFTKTLTDGLSLMWDLRQGRVDVLLNLFPNVAEWLKVKLTPPPTMDTSGLEAKIDRLEKLLLEQGINIPETDRYAAGYIPPAYKPGRALPPKPINDTPMVAANDDSSQTFLDAFM